MNIREPVFMGSWYPGNPEKIREFLDPFRKNTSVNPSQDLNSAARAAIAPHAGWFYSGKIAARSVSNLDSRAETAVIIGGHLPAGAPFLFAAEDAAKTPFGTMQIDNELRDLLAGKLDGRNDKYRDNTVEIILPMIHSFFPNARLLWTRFPADRSAFEAGKILAKAGKSLGRSLVVLGSTDLTHYGANYGYSPKGTGKAALDWVRNKNDAAFIQAVLRKDHAEALRCANEDYSACSAGAVLGVLGFLDSLQEIHAQAGPADSAGFRGELLEYGTSTDAGDGEIPDSFVGYASIVFRTLSS